MNQLLHPGESLTVKDGDEPCRVGAFLGGGGQGEVYRVRWKDHDYALKWYFPRMASDEQFSALTTLTRIGPPDERFLWPLEVTARRAPGQFGYLMHLRPVEFKSINDLMLRRIEPSFRALVTAGFQLADSFLRLHSKGLCYRDISFGNVFLNSETGDILICDNDNVGVNLEAPAGVLGTPRFMAPEIVRGDAKPSSDSDLFSLAVLLFYMFYLHHPLEGAREWAIKAFDLPAMNRLYGFAPVYIFHPTDSSNRPVPGGHDNAIIFHKIYPRFIRTLFERTFTKGIEDCSQERTRESEWRHALIRLRDLIVYCTCHAENFFDPELGRAPPCWNCQADVPLPMRLSIDRSLVMLNHDTELFPHHVDDNCAYDFSTPVARVTRHPTNPRVWGLLNLTNQSWTVTFSDSTTKSVPPGKSAPIGVGNELQFGKRKAAMSA